MVRPGPSLLFLESQSQGGPRWPYVMCSGWVGAFPPLPCILKSGQERQLDHTQRNQHLPTERNAPHTIVTIEAGIH